MTLTVPVRLALAAALTVVAALIVAVLLVNRRGYPAPKGSPVHCVNGACVDVLPGPYVATRRTGG